jgi:hypothetical protein
MVILGKPITFGLSWRRTMTSSVRRALQSWGIGPGSAGISQAENSRNLDLRSKNVEFSLQPLDFSGKGLSVPLP